MKCNNEAQTHWATKIKIYTRNISWGSLRNWNSEKAVMIFPCAKVNKLCIIVHKKLNQFWNEIKSIISCFFTWILDYSIINQNSVWDITRRWNGFGTGMTFTVFQTKRTWHWLLMPLTPIYIPRWTAVTWIKSADKTSNHRIKIPQEDFLFVSSCLR